MVPVLQSLELCVTSIAAFFSTALISGCSSEIESASTQENGHHTIFSKVVVKKAAMIDY